MACISELSEIYSQTDPRQGWDGGSRVTNLARMRVQCTYIPGMIIYIEYYSKGYISHPGRILYPHLSRRAFSEFSTFDVNNIISDVLKRTTFNLF